MLMCPGCIIVDTSQCVLQNVSSIAAWQRFGYAAHHLVSQQVNIDCNSRRLSRRAAVQQTLQHNQPLLEALLKEGKQLFQEHKGTKNWPISYAQACGLYCCASKVMVQVKPGTGHFNRLVQGCLSTASYLVETPLLVQPENRNAKKLKQAACDDAAPGEPFCDTSKGAIRLHGIMIAREIVVSLAEDFTQFEGLDIVDKDVYERVVEAPPSVNKHTIAIDTALAQLRVKQLRVRMLNCLDALRCSATLPHTNAATFAICSCSTSKWQKLSLNDFVTEQFSL
jgi:hypothetical protein